MVNLDLLGKDGCDEAKMKVELEKAIQQQYQAKIQVQFSMNN